MTLETRRIDIATGIALNVQTGGPADAPAILFLHGFPESHRTWRHVMPDLARDFRVVAPDQRGFGASDRPDGVDQYGVDKTIPDVFALADALGLSRFTLVGHEWGGAVAWGAGLKRPDRLDRLVILNAPHPYLFQRSLIENEAQRAASQYINAFRSPLMEKGIEAMGLDAFFAKSFGGHVDLSIIPADEKQAYLDDWSRPGALTAMLNWYRAARFDVPAPGQPARMPDWAKGPFPSVRVPTLVIWGMKDKALLPVLLDGLGSLIDDYRLVKVEEAGHFVPWERPAPVIAAIRDFMGAR